MHRCRNERGKALTGSAAVKITAVRKELYDTIAWLDRAAAEAKAIYSKGAKANKEYNLIYKQCEDEFEKAKPDIEAAKAEADTREKASRLNL